jgi:hypothetical protein
MMTETKNTDKIELVRAALYHPDKRVAALRVIENMSVEEKQQLFYELLEVACYSHGLTHFARELILSLPHDWLVENIEQYAEPILRREDYEEYRGILAIYSEIDKDLTRKLAERAIKHDDLDIREAGEDFLSKRE